MATQYSKKSAYGLTPVTDHYLDLMVNRSIPKLASDEKVRLTQTYHMNPSLLAFDLYGDAELWWVFAQRNPDILKNPLVDFAVGTEIYVPELDTLRNTLGF